MMLDLTPLEKALAQLEASLGYMSATPAEADPGLHNQLRVAAIHAFEVSFELCWKMLRRRLEADAASSEEVDWLSFKDLLRLGAERGLIADPEAWFRYRERRNITTHTYDDAKAAQVSEALPEFLLAAKDLLDRLREIQ